MLDIIKTVVMPIVSKFIPDASQQATAAEQVSQAMIQLQLEDAKSQDLYIKRARPTFMYVMYLLLLVAVPCGILYIVNPKLANAFVDGAGAWFSALPDSLYNLLEVCFGVYGIGRSAEKITKNWKKK